MAMPATIPAIIELQTESAKEVVDITARVEALLDGTKGGSCLLYLRHTTAGLMVVTFETGVPEEVLMEFEGPRRRQIEMRLLAEA